MKRPLFVLVMLVALSSSRICAQTLTSAFNTKWLKTIASIEMFVTGRYVPIGTGFVVTTPNKHVALVTAKHVIVDENGKIFPNLFYRLNEQQNSSQVFRANYPPKYIDTVNQGWFLSGRYDLACRLIVFNETSDLVAIDSSDCLTVSFVQPGANVIVLGFPLGLRAEQYANPLLRHGIVARAEANEIVLDAFVFPGNSGGPVLYSPILKIGVGLTSTQVNEERVIGIVSNYISYSDVAISTHTKRPRIVFEENSGLCNITPIDALLSLLKSKEFAALDMTLFRYR